MTLGQKLKKLRTDKGLTQKDLADEIHVTFQTISKWESDTNEPDIATLKELAKFYGCSFDYLLSDEEELKEKEKKEEVVEKVEVVPAPVVPPTEVITKTIIIHEKELHVCAKCGKDIPEEDLVSVDNVRKERHGRMTRTVTTGQTYYHKACLEERKKEIASAEHKAKLEKASKSKKKCFGWGIAAGVVGFGAALTVFLFNTQYVHPALGVLFSVLIGYALFSMLYCILSGSYIGDVFLWCASLSIKFPGLIFSWDLGGFVWLIAMKVLFAALGFLVGVLALLLAIGLSSILGFVSFPFVLIHNINTDYADAF